MSVLKDNLSSFSFQLGNRFDFDAIFLKKSQKNLVAKASKDRPSTAFTEDLEEINVDDYSSNPNFGNYQDDSSCSGRPRSGCADREFKNKSRKSNYDSGSESFSAPAGSRMTRIIEYRKVFEKSKNEIILNDFTSLPKAIQVSWELLYTEFVKQHDYQCIIDLEKSFKSLKFPQIEYGDTTDFLYDSILFMSQYYQNNTLLFNAMLNLIDLLTSRESASRYYPQVLESPRKILLALAFATKSTMDMSLSFSFFALSLQVLTSFDSRLWSIKVIYLCFFPKAFDGHNTFVERMKRKRQARLFKGDGSEKIKKRFEFFGNDDTDVLESDSAFISHVMRVIWLMAVLSAYHSVKDTKEAKDIWDLVAEEIKYMTKKPHFKFKALYQFIPMNYGAVEAKSIAMFVDQMKAYSFRPMNPLEICAIFFDPCEYFAIRIYCFGKNIILT